MDDFKKPPVDRLKRPLGPTQGVKYQTQPAPQRPLGSQPLQSLQPSFQPASQNSVVSSPPPLNRPVKKRKKTLMWIFLAIICFVGIASAGVYSWFQIQLQPVDSSKTTKQLVAIKEGSTPSSIADQLKNAGLIRNADAFLIQARLKNVQSQFQAGTYRLAPSESTPQIIEHIINGKVDTFKITFLPGATLADNKKALVAAGYTEQQVNQAFAAQYTSPLFSGKPAGSDLEGYIYGETYTMPSDATVNQVLERTFEEFYKIVKKNNLIALYQARGLSLYQGVTLASIVQREASPKADDMTQIAQVFYKRLSIGMPLGSDVTYQYIADKTGQVRSPDLDSPYNTRKYPGLPPGPISAPGEKALKAVAQPASTDYLYFLSGDDDVTYFARTLEEHEANKKYCQKKCQII